MSRPRWLGGTAVRTALYLALGVLPSLFPLALSLIFLPGFWKLLPVAGVWGLVAAAFLPPKQLGAMQCLGVVAFLVCGLAADGAWGWYAAADAYRTRTMNFGHLMFAGPAACVLAYLLEFALAVLRPTAAAGR